MSLSVLYYCICAFLCCCRSFNLSLCRLSLFLLPKSRCLKAMSLVKILGTDQKVWGGEVGGGPEHLEIWLIKNT